MGLPLPHGKLAMWLFLVTEIMFFTGLIGTYVLLRNGQPNPKTEPWPTPDDVHLVEWVGAFNTFVLICSSLTVVLAHYALGKGNVKRATQLVGITLALGCVFLVVKAFEYNSKFAHGILPGRVHEKLDGPGGPRYVRHVEKELRHIVEHPDKAVGVSTASAGEWEEFLKKTVEPRAKALKEKEDIDEKVKKNTLKASAGEKQKQEIDDKLAKDLKDQSKKLAESREDLAPVIAAWELLERLPVLGARQVNLEIAGSKYVKDKKALEVAGDPGDIKGLIHEYPNLHLSYAIPFGNMWASCYFALTGIHALHVFGGLVIFAIMLLMARRGQFGVQHEAMVEYTGLYWHFVDIVWIFLFPLLYLV